MRIRLIRKLAQSMNGVDVSRVKVGDIVDLDDERGEMMIESGWAERIDDRGVISSDVVAAVRRRRSRSGPR